MSFANCEKVQQELVAYVDDELDPGLRAEIEAHLAVCAACRVRREELGRTIARVDVLPVTAPAPDLLRRFEERIERERKGIFGGFLTWLARPRVLVGASLAACLLIVLMVIVRPGGSPGSDDAELAIAGHLDLFSDYEAIKNLDVLEDLEFIESLDLDA
ncbi:MAG TPA: zf-HC2 domain-containing protein [Myxococcota bacterium]|nr:zf-HC2 domain-containing protein [Myxococcota bacterium]